MRNYSQLTIPLCAQIGRDVEQAIAKIQSGNRFLGAFNASSEAGYPQDSAEERLFSALYLSHLDGVRVTTDRNGIILRVENKY